MNRRCATHPKAGATSRSRAYRAARGRSHCGAGATAGFAGGVPIGTSAGASPCADSNASKPPKAKASKPAKIQIAQISQFGRPAGLGAGGRRNTMVGSRLPGMALSCRVAMTSDGSISGGRSATTTLRSSRMTWARVGGACAADCCATMASSSSSSSSSSACGSGCPGGPGCREWDDNTRGLYAG